MYCLRCQGLRRKDHYLDLESGFGEMWTRSWRCLTCGAVQDAVIEKHRLTRLKKLLPFASAETSTLEEEIYLGGEAFIRPAA